MGITYAIQGLNRTRRWRTEEADLSAWLPELGHTDLLLPSDWDFHHQLSWFQTYRHRQELHQRLSWVSSLLTTNPGTSQSPYCVSQFLYDKSVCLSLHIINIYIYLYLWRILTIILCKGFSAWNTVKTQKNVSYDDEDNDDDDDLLLNIVTCSNYLASILFSHSIT